MRRRLALLLAFVLVLLALLALRPRPAPRPAALEFGPPPDVQGAWDTAAAPALAKDGQAAPRGEADAAPIDEVSPDGGPTVLVRCAVVLGDEVPRGGNLWEVLPEGLFRSGDVEVEGAEVRFRTMEPTGGGDLKLEGYRAFEVAWEQTGPHEARCVGDPPRPPFLSAEVVGVVLDLQPEEIEEIRVSHCDGGTRSIDGEGRFDFRTAPGRCRLQAMRRHGRLTAYGRPVDVVIVPWDVVEVELEPPPPWRPAGLGISYETGEEGARVLSLIDGGPAARAGLRQGDLIVAVDGVSMAGVGVQEFLDYGLGPEGSEVELTVRSGDVERTVTFFRETLPAPR